MRSSPWLGGAVFLSVIAAACGAFGTDSAAPGSGTDGGGTSGGASGNGDAASAADAVPRSDGAIGADWPGDPPMIHLGCDARTPRPTYCEDFDHDNVLPTGEGTFSLLSTSLSDRHLEVVVNDNTSGAERLVVPLPGLAHRIRWSFDMLVTQSLLAETELMQVLADLDKRCALQFRRTSGGDLELVEYCGNTDQSSVVLAMPTSAEWVSIVAAIDFDRGTYEARSRSSAGLATPPPVKLKLLAPSASAELDVGIS